jgi:hypothetical protein
MGVSLGIIVSLRLGSRHREQRVGGVEREIDRLFCILNSQAAFSPRSVAEKTQFADRDNAARPVQSPIASEIAQA